ncbi:hypothetical protein CABS03_02328 [Colletotrichum abscissum]|uniref:Uncharacterized protein n=1 Tax=Colletotrichum abscissum TaxID=1671311 RepID=A0A9P9X2K5_9PEZI|nr:hypothetical protein CABS02_13721 [Colletotrichum abscissum]
MREGIGTRSNLSSLCYFGQQPIPKVTYLALAPLAAWKTSFPLPRNARAAPPTPPTVRPWKAVGTFWNGIASLSQKSVVVPRHGTSRRQ